jgi:hypothetical protein
MVSEGMVSMVFVMRWAKNEMADQQRNIFLTVAQRRHMDGR